MERALRWVRFQFSGSPQKCGFGCACVLCLPRSVRFRQPEAWAHSPRMRRAFSSAAPVRAAEPGLRKSLDRNRGPVCIVGGGGFSGAEFAPFPSPCLLPPAGMGRLFSGVSQSLCLVNHRQCVRAGWFSLLLSHSLKKLLPTALRAFGLVLTLSSAASSSPFRPHLLVAGAGVWSTFLLGVAFRHVICEPYLIFPPS